VLDWAAEMDIFPFLIKFGYKAFGFSFNDFPFARNGYNFNQASDLKEPWVFEHLTGGRLAACARYCILKLEVVCYLPNQFSLIEFIASLLNHKYRYTRQSIETLCQQSQRSKYGF